VNYTALTLQLLPEVILVATALLVMGVAVASHARRRRELSARVTMALALAGVVLAGAALRMPPPSGADFASLLSTAPLVRLFKGIVLALAVPALLLPPARKEIAQPGEFHALMLFAIAGLLLAIGANNLLLLFVALELASLSLYLLAGFPRTARAAEASMKYFLFGGVSAAFFLFGISLLYGFSPDLSMAGFRAALAGQPMPLFAAAGLVMVLAGFAFKLAAVPFHFWAPDVYEGAPATTVALVSAASKAVGVTVLARLLMTSFGTAAGSAAWGGMSAGWTLWLAALAAVSMLAGNLLALAQTSVRRLLAYSAVANTGYILTGLAANGPQAAASSLFYTVVYGLATLGALAVTAAVERERGTDSTAAFSGLVHRSPGLAIALFICLASLAGIPPLAGFTGKFAIFSSAMAADTGAVAPGLLWLVTLGAIMSAVSLYYYLLVLKQCFVHGVAGAPVPPESARQSLGLSHGLAVALPALLLLALGFFPSILLHPISKAVHTLLQPH
jgi:NADH-quinone oxidoreductase subunit N